MTPIALKLQKEVAKDTLLYAFSRPQDFLFEAGQYVSLKVTKAPFRDDKGDFRAFSIASAPYQKDVLEFVMRRSDSAFKKNLESLGVGDSVEITPAVGKCILPPVGANTGIVFLVGGVGVTPARSMLFEANYRHRPEKFYLFNSNRCVEYAPFLAEFDALGDIDLTRVYTMSDRELTGLPWRGERGRIDVAMIRRYVTIDWSECMFYIAGVGAFVRAIREALLAEGVATEKILADDFGGASS